MDRPNKEQRKEIIDKYITKMSQHLPILRTTIKITQNQLAKTLAIARILMGA